MTSQNYGLENRLRLKGVQVDETLVRGLLTVDAVQRDDWLVRALQMRNRSSLAAVEEAIARLAKRADLRFYQPLGVVPLDADQEREVMDALLELARRDNLLTDIVHTQSLMPRAGKANTSQMLEKLGKISASALQIFQLLGIQMQIAIMLGPKGK